MTDLKQWAIYPTKADRESVTPGPIRMRHERCGELVTVYCDTRTVAGVVELAQAHRCPPVAPRTWEGDQS